MASQHLFDEQTVIGSSVTSTPTRRAGPGILGALGRALAWAELAASIHRERRELSRLPDALRRDIGLSDAEIGEEARQPWFAIPASRLRRLPSRRQAQR